MVYTTFQEDIQDSNEESQIKPEKGSEVRSNPIYLLRLYSQVSRSDKTSIVTGLLW